ncbi:MAG: 6-carboxyhexanoate--CoA ligase [Nitrospirae bacterium]|nr:6-carboxyhexanoate--CoA ligase [Nitrospirota bacterium]
MWNVRIRASRKTCVSNLHISGAEGLYDTRELPQTVTAYVRRVLGHSRGLPDTINITIESMEQGPVSVPLLNVKTIRCSSPDRAHKIISEILTDMDITQRAISAASRVLTSTNVMRGASLITARTGLRIEPDKKRGVRVSRLGIKRAERRKLALSLSRLRINTETVQEALLLASKAASCQGILAEVCISDDPDYTTGYIAGRDIGYVRIPNIKSRCDMHGGRVFFIREEADPDPIINYLEREPVLLCNG